MGSNQPQNLPHTHILPAYNTVNLSFEYGKGCYLYTKDGDRYLDFASGIAVNSLGYSHSRLVKALTHQAKKLWHSSNLYKVDLQEVLAEKFVKHSFADKVFFCNSGTEANEAAIKFIRKYFRENGQPERYRIVTFQGGFHGRTLGALSACDSRAKARKDFEPLLEGFDNVEFGNIEAVRSVITKETAAILIEPIQSEGGIREAEYEFMKQIREVCDKHGLLLCLDEVQTGMGRTGKLFACELSGVIPDIMTLAKGIGGGFPLAACLVSNKIAAAINPGCHGGTYCGNPLAMAVGNAVIDIITEDGFLDQVNKTSEYLHRKIKSLVKMFPDLISEVRGAGLMIGIKVTSISNYELAAKFREDGLLTVPSVNDNVVRILPPLIINQKQVNEAISIMEKSFVNF